MYWCRDMSTPNDIFRTEDALRIDAITRREALRRMGLLAAAAAAAGCTPLRMALHAYPEAFDDRERADSALAAFVRTVIPGAEGTDEELSRAFHDRAYPFASHAAFFASDLCRRARRLYSNRAFEYLEEGARAMVVRDGLDADGITRRIYGGAIFLAQVATFAGIYDDDAGCALIDFPGSNAGYLPEEYSYANPEAFLPAAITPDGNYA